MAQSREFPQFAWVPPRSYTVGRRAGLPRVLVVHSTEGSEGPTAAEGGAAYDARRTDGTSAHFFPDSNSVVQCVLTTNEAHTARSYGNDIGIQFEFTGRAGQTRTQWLDPISRATIRNGAYAMSLCAAKYNIAIRHMTVAEVRSVHPNFGNRDIRGICSHYDITRAFPENKGSHTDPGPNFPWDVLLEDIEEFLGGEDMNSEQDRRLYNIDRVVSAILNKSDDVTGIRTSVDSDVTEDFEGVLAPFKGGNISVDADALAAALAPLLTGVDLSKVNAALTKIGEAGSKLSEINDPQ